MAAPARGQASRVVRHHEYAARELGRLTERGGWRRHQRAVSVVLPVTVPEVAEMVVVPAATAVARPPAAIVAVAVLLDAHVAVAVRSCVEPSVYVPVAVNCCVSPLATLGFAGVTAIETSTAGRTVSVVLPVTPPNVAETVVVPAACVVARPPAAIVAVNMSVDAQVAVAVRSCVELSE